jgi:hypothetical protein
MGKKWTEEQRANFAKAMARKRRAQLKQENDGVLAAPKYKKGPRDLSMVKIAPGMYLLRVV